MKEPGIGAEPAHQIVNRLVTPHRFRQRSAAAGGKRGELSLKRRLEVGTFDVDPVEIALDGGIVEAGIKVAEIPFRQRAEACLEILRGILFGPLLGTAVEPPRGAARARLVRRFGHDLT